MAKLFKWDFLSIVSVLSIVVFGVSIVTVAIYDLSQKGKMIFLIITVASFFTSLSTIMQLQSKRQKGGRNT
jgi:hypothetical protein